MNRKAFTWIELLVVIAILTILTGLLLAGVQKVRESASRVTCQNNAKQIALALHHHHDAHGSLPAGIQEPRGKSLYPAAGWQLPILPYVEQQSIYNEALSEYKRTPRFDDRSLNSYPHVGLSHVIKIYVCPSDARIHERYLSANLGYFVAFTSYLGNCGQNCNSTDGLLFMDSAIQFREVSDGLSNTLIFGERPPSSDRELGWWYAGIGQDGKGSAEMILGVREVFTGETGNIGSCEKRVYEFVPGRFSNPCDAMHFWSPHPGGAFFGFADGSIRFLSYQSNPLLPALASRHGKEVVAQPDSTKPIGTNAFPIKLN